MYRGADPVAEEVHAVTARYENVAGADLGFGRIVTLYQPPIHFISESLTHSVHLFLKR
jgi:hypothetical protein